MTIRTEHNGHEITYSENEDVWRCWQLDVEAKTLSLLKTKINKIEADARRVDNMPGIYIDYSGRTKRCSITLMDGEMVWITMQEKHKNGHVSTRRQKVRMKEVAPDTPEAIAKIKEYHQAQAIYLRAGEAERAAKAAIPTLTAEMLVGVPGPA